MPSRENTRASIADDVTSKLTVRLSSPSLTSRTAIPQMLPVLAPKSTGHTYPDASPLPSPRSTESASFPDGACFFTCGALAFRCMRTEISGRLRNATATTRRRRASHPLYL
ncbi:hypothetical protein C8R44DRAFT_248971 [Mycena epipterygia]|nr:hypothetical protein C8R44DRAFT_248971 [Mycena epipterygia]